MSNPVEFDELLILYKVMFYGFYHSKSAKRSDDDMRAAMISL